MIQTFEESVIITGLLPDPVTLFVRIMEFEKLEIDQTQKRIKVTWSVKQIAPGTQEVFSMLNVRKEQIADNTALVNLANPEVMYSISEYEALPETKPDVMGEYDFWQYANKNSPFPVMLQIAQAGERFAVRNGLK